MEYENHTLFPDTFLSNFSGEFEPTEAVFQRPMGTKVLASFVTFIIALISIFGNALVVIASITNENLREQVGNYLVANQSFFDILTGLLVMLPSSVSVALNYWPFGSKMCKFHALVNYTFACNTSLNLTAISIDRAIAVVYPFKYRVVMTTKVMIFMCFVCFILSFGVGMACAGPDWTGYDTTEAVCAMQYTAINPGVYYAITSGCTCCYYIPITILSVCNTMIIRAARKSDKNVVFVRRDNANNINNNLKASQQNDSQMKKTIKSMMVVVISYYLWCTPYAIGKQVKVKTGLDMPPWFNYLSTIFAFLSSAVNPFIYAILRKDYQDAFKKLLKQMAQTFFR